MSSGFDRAVQNLMQIIKESDKNKTFALDTQAEVLRIEEGTAWVHLPGGVDETPVKLTMNAQVGDVVQVRIAGGRAWLTGNATSPPTDDKVANQAMGAAASAQQEVITVKEVVAENIRATNAKFEYVEADTAKIHNLEADEIHAGITYTNELIAGNVTTEKLTAASGYIQELVAEDITAQDITAASGYIQELVAEDITAQDITADHAEINDLDVNYAQIDAANINTAAIRSAWVDQMMVQSGLIAHEGTVYELDAIQVNASKIKTGTLDVERLIVSVPDPQDPTKIHKYMVHVDPSTGSPSYEKVDADVLEDLTITADKIVAGAITAEKITTENIVGSGGWINLRNGTFNYTNASTGNGISWDGQHLNIKANTITMGSSQQTLEQIIEGMQSEIDGAIETWYESQDPLPDATHPNQSNAPASSWTTTEQKNNHLRDLYFNTTNGHSYRWAQVGNAYYWVQIEDADAIKALADAAAAQETADNGLALAGVKRRVFVATPVPPYDVGDLWMQGANGDIMKCKTAKAKNASYAAADWEKASKYTDDSNVYTKSDFSITPSQIISKVSANETNIAKKANSADVYTKTETDSAINQKAGEIDISVTQKISEVQVGGRNLHKDSKNLGSSWALNNATVSNDVATITRTSSTTGEYRIYQMPANGYWSWEPNTEYVVSIEAKGNAGGEELQFTCNGGGTPTYHDANPKLTTSWKRYSRSFKTGSSVSTGSMSYYYGGTEAGSIQLRNPKLEKGTKATDWTPAPEDQVGVDEVINRINVSTEGILIQASKVAIDGSAIFSNSAFQTKLADSQNAYTILWDKNYGTDAAGGEAIIQKKDPLTGTITNAAGWVIWNGTKRTVPAVEYNPNAMVPYNIPVYLVLRLSSASSTTGTVYPVWYANSKWNYLNKGPNAATTDNAVADWTWVEATDIVLGSCVEPASETIFTDCVIYDPPWTCKQVTSDTVTARSANAAAAAAQTTANNAAPKSSAVAEEQLIYISKASGTSSVAANTTWVTETGDKQNTWTTKRLTYNSSYPVLFVAKQKKVVSGTVTCTTPVKDDTTTVIDGGHITTGTIDASKATITNINASNISSGTLSADRIAAGALAIGKLNTDTQNKINNGDSALTKVNYYNRTCHVGNSSNTQTAYWRKFASYVETGQNADPFIIFDVMSSGDMSTYKQFGRLKAHIRTSGTVGTVDAGNCTLQWITKGEGINLSDFVLAYKATSGTDVKVELWCKCDKSWVGYRFNMVQEGDRTTESTSAKWTLYDSFTANGLSAITSGYTQVVSTYIDAAKDTADNYIYMDSSGIRIASASPSSQKQRLYLTSSEAALYSSDDVKRVSITSSTGVVVGNASKGHTVVNDAGLYIYDTNNKKRSQTDANGLHVYGTDGSTEVALFGATSRLGTASGARVETTSSGMRVYNASNAQRAEFGGDWALIGNPSNTRVTISTSSDNPYIFMGDKNNVQCFRANADGVTIANPSSGHSTIKSDGLHVWTGAESTATNEVAFFGSTARVGKSSSGHISVGTSAIDLYSNTTLAVRISEYTSGTGQITVYGANSSGTRIVPAGIQIYGSADSDQAEFYSSYLCFGSRSSGHKNVELYTGDNAGFEVMNSSRGGYLTTEGRLEAGTRFKSQYCYDNTISTDNRVAITSAGNMGKYKSSSRRYKDQIEDSTFDPHGLYNLRARQFRYKDGYFALDDDNPHAYDLQVGFIAEEVEQYYPAAVVYDTDTGEIENWEERKMIPPMLTLIQELNDRLTKLEQKGVA